MLRRPHYTSADVIYDYALLVELLEDLPLIFCIQDTSNGHILKCNQLFEKLEISSILKEGKFQALQPENFKVISVKDKEAEDEYRYFKITTRQIRQQERDLLLITGWDITQEYLNTAAMDETGILKVAFDRCNEMIFMTDERGKIQFQNKSLRNYSGHESAVTSGNFMKILHPEDAALMKELLDDAVRTKQGNCHELRIQRADGNFRWVNLQLSARINEAGDFAGIIGFIADVHPAKKERDRVSENILSRTSHLEEINKDLQRSNDDLEQFAYVASHDLQEPLRKISLYSSRLQESSSTLSDAENKLYLYKIREATARMTSLIHDLLNYSIISRQKDIFHPTNLTTIVNTVINDYDLLIAQKNAQVEVNPLPVIDANAVMLNQLFYNLVGNSLKFTSDDRRPCIRISSKYVNKINSQGTYQDMVEISVADNGIGFEQNNADKIFDLFTRLHPKSRYNGSGIGLALCRKIADNHNGYIIAESNNSEGAVFKVTLPVKQAVQGTEFGQSIIKNGNAKSE